MIVMSLSCCRDLSNSGSKGWRLLKVVVHDNDSLRVCHQADLDIRSKVEGKMPRLRVFHTQLCFLNASSFVVVSHNEGIIWVECPL